jgi:uncharacterized hydrophobic protein (TIGR00271 family)
MTSDLFRRVLGHVTRTRQAIAHQMLLPDLTEDDGRAMRQAVAADGALTSGYALMCALSAGIATLGLLQSSVAVVIGAMIISPLMAPIAALGFGFASLDGHRIRDAAKVVAIGAAIGIFTSLIITWASPIRNATSEIISRTQPTLLDLAIALLSGIAGGYAIVRNKGGTAIGVAIATALMPPLATVGYGLGTLRLDYAGGAFLLFLTNLAAIAFSFALIARLGGAASTLSRVKMSPAYIAAGTLIFLALATPLALTLLRVSHESKARTAARREIIKTLGVRDQDIARVDVSWPLWGQPQVSAVVIAPRYVANAQANLATRLSSELVAKTRVVLQQVVAGDVLAHTQALVDAAIDQSAAVVANDVPPLAEIKAELPLPVQSVWIDSANRSVHIVPAAAPAWTLGDFRQMEIAAQAKFDDWKVEIIPPPQSNLILQISFDGNGKAGIADNDRDVALWAIDRWGVKKLGLTSIGSPPVKKAGEERTGQALKLVQEMLASNKVSSAIVAAGTNATDRQSKPRQSGSGVGIDVIVFGSPPRPATQTATGCNMVAGTHCPAQSVAK